MLIRNLAILLKLLWFCSFIVIKFLRLVVVIIPKIFKWMYYVVSDMDDKDFDTVMLVICLGLPALALLIGMSIIGFRISF